MLLYFHTFWPCQLQLGHKFEFYLFALLQDIYIQGVFLLVRPNFSAKKKNVVQSMRIFCTSRISWNRIFDWLPSVFHFGTGNWADQSKKPPCTI